MGDQDDTVQPSPEWYRKIGNGPPPAAEVKKTRNSDSESKPEHTKLQIVQEEELEDDLLNNSMKHVKHSDKGDQSNFEAFDQPKFPQLPDKVIYAPDLSVDKQEATVEDEETERDDSLNEDGDEECPTRFGDYFKEFGTTMKTSSKKLWDSAKRGKLMANRFQKYLGASRTH